MMGWSNYSCGGQSLRTKRKFARDGTHAFRDLNRRNVMSRSVYALLAATSLSLVSAPASATFISGAFGASQPFGGVSNPVPAPTGALLPVALTFNPGSGSGSGDLAVLVSFLTTVGAFSQPSAAATGFAITSGAFVWTITGITPAVATLGALLPLECSAGSCSQGFTYNVSGTVDDGAGPFDPSIFSGIFSVSATCADAIANAVCDSEAARNTTWTFVASSAGDVPEPSALAVLAAGLLGLGVFRARRLVRESAP